MPEPKPASPAFVISIPGTWIGYLLSASLGANMFTILVAMTQPKYWWVGMLVGTLAGVLEHSLSPKPVITATVDLAPPLEKAEQFAAVLDRVWNSLAERVRRLFRRPPRPTPPE